MMRVWPFLVNELEPQCLLHDWRKVYECLARFGIPVPRYSCVHREVPCWHLDYFVEEVDFVEVMGTAFGNLVEKPTVDGWERSISYLLLCSRCHASLLARGSHKQ